MICQSAECSAALLQMKVWNYFTKPLLHWPFFVRAICGKECTKPRSFVAYFWRVSELQGDAPNGTCTGDPFAFPVLTQEQQAHTWPAWWRETGWGNSTQLCMDLSPQHVSDDNHVSGVFQRTIKKKMHRYLINSYTANWASMCKAQSKLIYPRGKKSVYKYAFLIQLGYPSLFHHSFHACLSLKMW